MVNLDSGHDIHAERAAPHIQLSPSLWLGHVYLLVMNKTVWDGLDVKDRGAIKRAAAATQRRLGAAQDANLLEMVNQMKKDGASIHYLTNQELEAWQTATGYQQIQAEWVTQQEDKGITDAGLLMKGVSTIVNDVIR
ncbi:Bacterial extracellular solute-binding protein, family 7 [compost metagenome]